MALTHNAKQVAQKVNEQQGKQCMCSTLAAREPRGPAEMVLTRTPYLRPASKASTRVSDSSAAFAELMPPP